MPKQTFGYETLIFVLDQNLESKMTGVTPRDSDKEMIIQILQFSGCGLSAEQMTCIRKFNFESLTRARRKLQEKGQYYPSPEVAKRRKLKGWELQQTAVGESPQGIQRRIEEN